MNVILIGQLIFSTDQFNIVLMSVNILLLFALKQKRHFLGCIAPRKMPKAWVSISTIQSIFVRINWTINWFFVRK